MGPGRRGLSLGQTYRVFTLKNDVLTLETRENGVLENDDWDAKKKRVAFFAPEVTALTIDGAASGFGPSLSRSNSRPSISPGRISPFSVKGPGAILVSGRTVKVTLKP